jgi:hypothetical protein
MDEQSKSASGTQKAAAAEAGVKEQMSEAQAHHYDASKYERPSVTVDVLMMSLRLRDLQILLIKRRSVCKSRQRVMPATLDGSRYIACLRWPSTTRKLFSTHSIACGASSITRPLPLTYFQKSLRCVNCNESTKSFSTKGWISGIFVRES